MSMEEAGTDDFHISEVDVEEDQARLLDGYEPVGLVKLDRGRAGATGRRLERKGLGGSGVGASAGYAVTTHARTCSSVAPAS